MKLTKIDNIDKRIIETLQKNPSITHSQIAKNLERSQPAIGARIKKLSEKGILEWSRARTKPPPNPFREINRSARTRRRRTIDK